MACKTFLRPKSQRLYMFQRDQNKINTFIIIITTFFVHSVVLILVFHKSSFMQKVPYK